MKLLFSCLCFLIFTRSDHTPAAQIGNDKIAAVNNDQQHRCHSHRSQHKTHTHGFQQNMDKPDSHDGMDHCQQQRKGKINPYLLKQGFMNILFIHTDLAQHVIPLPVVSTFRQFLQCQDRRTAYKENNSQIQGNKSNQCPQSDTALGYIQSGIH